jgi:hypothetical protein
MSFGTLAGMMAADAACGVKNPWAELLDPRRNTQVPSEPWARALAAS